MTTITLDDVELGYIDRIERIWDDRTGQTIIDMYVNDQWIGSVMSDKQVIETDRNIGRKSK